MAVPLSLLSYLVQHTACHPAHASQPAPPAPSCQSRSTRPALHAPRQMLPDYCMYIRCMQWMMLQLQLPCQSYSQTFLQKGEFEGFGSPIPRLTSMPSFCCLQYEMRGRRPGRIYHMMCATTDVT